MLTGRKIISVGLFQNMDTGAVCSLQRFIQFLSQYRRNIEIKRSQIYRSAALDLLQTQEDRERLRALGLKTILDLRSRKEGNARPDPDVPGAMYFRRCATHYPDGRELDLSSQ